MKDERMIITLRNGTKDSVPEPLEARRPPSRSKGRWVVFAVVLLVLLCGGIGYYFFSTYPTLFAVPVNQGSATTTPTSVPVADVSNQDQTARLIAEVGRLIELPQQETPTIATVTDPSKLKDQPFFANAKAGDVVLMYTQARKAYLYDPKEKKLVEVAPITNQTP